MKQFFVYTVAENKMLGKVLAKDWVDARLEASRAWGYDFSKVFACEKPLPTV